LQQGGRYELDLRRLTGPIFDQVSESPPLPTTRIARVEMGRDQLGKLSGSRPGSPIAHPIRDRLLKLGTQLRTGTGSPSIETVQALLFRPEIHETSACFIEQALFGDHVRAPCESAKNAGKAKYGSCLEVRGSIQGSSSNSRGIHLPKPGNLPVVAKYHASTNEGLDDPPFEH
jgi:hypothetical protein